MTGENRNIGRRLRTDEINSVEIRQKAIGVALAITSGAYQTSLLTYLIQRDMFPSIMKVRLLSVLHRVAEVELSNMRTSS